jgi:UDP-N-acetylmuramoyl-tripeptide--D-alanyl-D-alanine ligase
MALSSEWVLFELPSVVSHLTDGLSFTKLVVDPFAISPDCLWFCMSEYGDNSAVLCIRAIELGAKAVIAPSAMRSVGVPGFFIDHPSEAIQKLATSRRKMFTGDLAAILGGNGKTTVTQMLKSIFEAVPNDISHVTFGNENNHIGVPVTLINIPWSGFDCSQRTRCAVEIGMNNFDEIDSLARLVKPTIALVNNAHREHLQFLGSVDNAAMENSKVFNAMETGVAVIPLGDAFSPYWQSAASHLNVLTFSCNDERAEVIATRTATDRLEIRTPRGAFNIENNTLCWSHNAHNAAAATAISLAANISIEAIACGLERFELPRGRMNQMILKLYNKSVNLFDDTYNSNPDSFEAAIDVIASLTGMKLLILGDMAECAEPSNVVHADAGRYAAEAGIDVIWSVGDMSRSASNQFGCPSKHFSSVEGLLVHIAACAAFDVVLLKGSRSMHMERVVDHLSRISSSA